MRRSGIWVWIDWALSPLPWLVLILLVISVLGTEAGGSLLAKGINTASGGRITVTSLTGLIPFAPRVESLVMADSQGPWLRIERAALSLERWSLWEAELVIRSLSAETVTLLRAPPPRSPRHQQAVFPGTIKVRELRVKELALDGLLSQAPRVAVNASGTLYGTGSLNASLDIRGQWATQSISALMQLDRNEQRLAISLREGRWGGIGFNGELQRDSGGDQPIGELNLDIPRLESLNPILSHWLRETTVPALTGQLDTQLLLKNGRLKITSTGHNVQLMGGLELDIRALRLGAEIAELPNPPNLRAQLALDGLRAPGLEGTWSARAEGPLGALEVSTDSRLRLSRFANSGDLQVTADGQLDLIARQLRVRTLALEGFNHGLRLIEPARISLSDGLAIEPLSLALLAPTAAGQRQPRGRLMVSGDLAPQLALQAKIDQLPVATALNWIPRPMPPLDGLIALESRIEGKLGAPRGSLRLRANGLRSTEGAARGLPPGELQLELHLDAAMAEIDARASAGARTDLQVLGRIGTPLASAREIAALRARGQADLAVLAPLLAPVGRALEGQLRMDVDVEGVPARPLAYGRLQLREGAWRDRRHGLAISKIDAAIRLSGEQLVIERAAAQAGDGTVRLEGEIGWLATDRPVNLRLVAREASPIQRDALQFVVNADLQLRGAPAERLDLSGVLRFPHIDLRVPARLPVSVAGLDVQEVGERRQPRQPRGLSKRGVANRWLADWRSRVGLDLSLTAPHSVTLSGRGIDAELGGELAASGTLAAPAVDGALRLLRGDYQLVGQRLRFTRGRIGFDGASVLDPVLDLEARVRAAGATAILAVEGTARAPRIRLRGEPEMPDDEVLARLLFGRSGSRLSTLQIARLGLAATSLAGVGRAGPGLLERTGAALGLDRFSVEAGEGARAEATLEGGRYVSERLYLGARQGGGEGATRGVLRMNISPRLRLETDVGSGSRARAGAAFELEY